MERFLSTNTIHSLDNNLINNLLNSLINSCLDIDLEPSPYYHSRILFFSLFKNSLAKRFKWDTGTLTTCLYILYIPIV